MNIDMSIYIYIKRQHFTFLKPPKSKIQWKMYRLFNILENHQTISMKLRHVDLEAILRPVWTTLANANLDSQGINWYIKRFFKSLPNSFQISWPSKIMVKSHWLA